MVGARIKHFREQLKMSQEELGKKVNIDQTLISRIERNERKVPADELPLFASALDVNILDLILGKEAI